jgi:hypothetical protein
MQADDDDRMELVLAPDGLWTVWDRTSDAPLEFSGRALVGLSEKEARCAMEVICCVLENRAAERRNDAA